MHSIVDPLGRITAQAPPFTQATLVGEVAWMEEKEGNSSMATTSRSIERCSETLGKLQASRQRRMVEAQLAQPQQKLAKIRRQPGAARGPSR